MCASLLIKLVRMAMMSPGPFPVGCRGCAARGSAAGGSFPSFFFGRAFAQALEVLGQNPLFKKDPSSARRPHCIASRRPHLSSSRKPHFIATRKLHLAPQFSSEAALHCTQNPDTTFAIPYWSRPHRLSFLQND
jgi:hypothetical protein